MGMLERIADDMKTALKGGDKFRLETLRTLRAVLLEKQVERRPSGGMTGEDEIAALTSASKKRRESIDVYRKAGREDLAGQEERELAIIQEFLPQQLTAAEIEKIVQAVVAEQQASGQKDFGKVMPLVMKQLKGKADGKLVQETVKRLLGT
jgi:uncharacterized protein YqeY